LRRRPRAAASLQPLEDLGRRRAIDARKQLELEQRSLALGRPVAGLELQRHERLAHVAERLLHVREAQVRVGDARVDAHRITVLLGGAREVAELLAAAAV
jgi:hypothetical protein